MQYLVLLLCCLLSTTKASIQGDFSKKHIKNLSDIVFFIGLVFAFSSLLFLPRVFGCPWQVWIFGAAFGIFSVIFQLSYTKALSLGNVSLTIMLSNLSMVVPILFSAIAYGEWPTLLQYVGIALTVVAFAINTDFKSGGKKSALWIILVLTTLLVGGTASCVQKIMSKTEFADQSQAFVSCAYIVAAIATFLVYLPIRKKQAKTYPTSPRVFLYALGVGVSLAAFQFVYNRAIATYPPAFVFPAYAGGTIIVSALAGIILFKDKLSLKQAISIFVGFAAVVLMNF